MTSIRFVVAGTAGLSPDEAYYWVWSKALAPGYLDHPPMVALFIRVGTAIAGDTALGIRLVAPIAAYLGSLLAWVAARDLTEDARAAWLAPLMLNATLLLAAGAVTMTPDTPLLLFWTATLAALGRFWRSGNGKWLLAAGLAAGLALDSKYTAALLAPAILLWLATEPSLRRWLATPWPYAACGLALALFAPVIAWNAAHGWASFARQGGRIGAFVPARALRFVTELIAGQIGLASPILAALFALGVWRAHRHGAGGRLLLWLTLIPALVFAEHALGDRVQANWPSILYPSAAIAGAAYARRLWRPACALGLALSGLVYVQATTFALPLPTHADPLRARLGSWPAFARDVFAKAAADHARFVTSDEYGLASLLAFYRPPDAPAVLGADPRWWLFRLDRAQEDGEGLLVRRSTRADTSQWSAIAPAGTVTREGAADEYALFTVTLNGDLPRLP